MPLRSKAQVRALFAKGRGDVVKRWQGEAPVSIHSLPERVGSNSLTRASKRRRRRRRPRPESEPPRGEVAPNG